MAIGQHVQKCYLTCSNQATRHTVAAVSTCLGCDKNVSYQRRWDAQCVRINDHQRSLSCCDRSIFSSTVILYIKVPSTNIYIYIYLVFKLIIYCQLGEFFSYLPPLSRTRISSIDWGGYFGWRGAIVGLWQHPLFQKSHKKKRPQTSSKKNMKWWLFSEFDRRVLGTPPTFIERFLRLL